MLFTDRACATPDDLIKVDPEVADLAATEQINLGDVCEQAVEECANRLLGEFQNFSYYWNAYTFVSAMPGMFWGQDSTPPPRINLAQVVVDSATTSMWSPLKRYTVYLALRNLYQIVSNRKVDDRYGKKRDNVDADIEIKYWRALRSSGLPVVLAPISCPGAQYELNQGTWGQSNVTAVAGSGPEQKGTYDVSLTWYCQNYPGNESAPSATVTLDVAAGKVIHIDINSLIPFIPNSNWGASVQPQGPSPVDSWKIYIGKSGGVQFLQASVPIGTKTFTLPSDPVLSGTPIGRGQRYDVNLTFINFFGKA